MVSVSDSVSFRCFFESRIQSRIRLDMGIVPDSDSSTQKLVSPTSGMRQPSICGEYKANSAFVPKYCMNSFKIPIDQITRGTNYKGSKLPASKFLEFNLLRRDFKGPK